MPKSRAHDCVELAYFLEEIVPSQDLYPPQHLFARLDIDPQNSLCGREQGQYAHGQCGGENNLGVEVFVGSLIDLLFGGNNQGCCMVRNAFLGVLKDFKTDFSSPSLSSLSAASLS